jgi:hypothetical protein
MKFEWEIIKYVKDESKILDMHFRAKVINGWIYRIVSFERKTESLVFIPDAKHEWEINKE